MKIPTRWVGYRIWKDVGLLVERFAHHS